MLQLQDVKSCCPQSGSLNGCVGHTNTANSCWARTVKKKQGFVCQPHTEMEDGAIQSLKHILNEIISEVPKPQNSHPPSFTGSRCCASEASSHAESRAGHSAGIGPTTACWQPGTAPHRPQKAKRNRSLARVLAGCPVIPPEVKGDERPCGQLPSSRFSPIFPHVGVVGWGGGAATRTFPMRHPRVGEHRISTSVPPPQGTAAGFCVCQTTWL